jgi:hypothetical protein
VGSWLVAFGTAAGILMIVATIRGASIKQIIQTDSLWPLAIILPALIFGKVLGLISINLVVYFTPLGRVFEQECRDTGRQDFRTATFFLVRTAFVLLVVTIVGAALFLSFSR